MPEGFCEIEKVTVTFLSLTIYDRNMGHDPCNWEEECRALLLPHT